MSHTPFDLTGKVALITGASRGLGQYLGRALARAGADLAITSRTAESLAPFQQEIEALGRRAFPVALDVRDHDSIQRAVDAVHGHYGRIDILVNNAGCNVRKPALDWDDGTSPETNLQDLLRRPGRRPHDDPAASTASLTSSVMSGMLGQLLLYEPRRHGSP